MWMTFHVIHTQLMTRLLVQYMLTFLNMFLSKNVISSDLSPSAIAIGSPNPDYNNLRITFGEYTQVFSWISQLARRTLRAC